MTKPSMSETVKRAREAIGDDWHVIADYPVGFEAIPAALVGMTTPRNTLIVQVVNVYPMQYCVSRGGVTIAPRCAIENLRRVVNRAEADAISYASKVTA